MRRRSIILLLLSAGIFAGCFVGCGYDRADDPAPPSLEEVIPNMEIAQLRSLYSGSAVAIMHDIVLSGWVTANDRSGNFYRTFVLDDGTGAVEVKAGMTEMHNIFVLGRRVSVKAKGLTLGSYDGVFQIGLASADGAFQCDFMGYRAVMDLYIYPQNDFRQAAPVELAAEALRSELCGRLVKVDGMWFEPPGAEPGPFSWAYSSAGPGSAPRTAYREFVAVGGARIAVVTSGYADFANEEVPLTEVSLTGILMEGRTDTGQNMFLIKLRLLNDVEIY